MEEKSIKSEEEGVSQKKKPEYNNEEEGDIKSFIDFCCCRYSGELISEVVEFMRMRRSVEVVDLAFS